jgi:chromosome partitioning protein
MITIAMLNQKGGVGKTSLCHHLAGAIARRAIRVLLVDYDPQASLTQGLLGPEEAASIRPDRTTAAVAAGEEPDPGELILREVLPGIALAPSSAALAEYNLATPARQDLYVQARLRDFLHEEAMREGGGKADLCLVDCPPNLQLCAWQALIAADHLVIPVQAEDYGVQGLAPVIDFLAQVRFQDNPGLSLAGILINKFEGRRTVHKFYEQNLRNQYGDDVLPHTLPDYAAFPEAVLNRQPVTAFDPRSKAADAINLIAGDLLDRWLPADQARATAPAPASRKEPRHGKA